MSYRGDDDVADVPGLKRGCLALIVLGIVGSLAYLAWALWQASNAGWL